MTRYVILLPGNEDYWDAAPMEERKATYAKHEEFSKLLAERGHTVVGGAELRHSREARVVRGTPGHVTVTEGPYAETVEQLTGFYLVESEDLDDLLQICGLLTGVEGAIEVRAAVGSSDPEVEPS